MNIKFIVYLLFMLYPRQLHGALIINIFHWFLITLFGVVVGWDEELLKIVDMFNDVNEECKQTICPQRVTVFCAHICTYCIVSVS